MGSYELYRKSSIGMSLTDALDELVTNGTISPLLAVKVLMQFDKRHRLKNLAQSGSTKNGTIPPTSMAVKELMQFDKSMNDALSQKVKSKANFKGHLHTYRFCDNVWTFILEKALFKIDGDSFNVDRVKIVACDAKIISR